MVDSNKKSNFDRLSYEVLHLLEGIKENCNFNKNQINTIEEGIRYMIKYHSKESFLPNYPRMIIDSWDFKHIITEKLLELYNLYIKL